MLSEKDGRHMKRPLSRVLEPSGIPFAWRYCRACVAAISLAEEMEELNPVPMVTL